MMTVYKCQVVVAAGSSRNPRVTLMAIIVASVSIDPHLCTGRTDVMVPLVGFHDRSPDDDKRDKQKRFDDHVFSTFRHTIHRGTTGHSGQQNPRFDVRRNLCRAMRHFYRLLVGWTRSTGVKWFRLARRNGQTLAVKRYERGSTSAARRS
jgi:hypothetical protein